MSYQIQRTFRRSFASAIALAALASSVPAFAYNNREHERMPDHAYQIMNVLRRGDYLTAMVNKTWGKSFAPLTTKPSSVPASEQAAWDRYITETREAADRLDKLPSGLSDPVNSSEQCGHAYPAVSQGSSLAACRAGELTFPVKRGWGKNDADCYVRKGYNEGDADSPAFYADLQNNFTGALLGYYSQAVDDEVDDIHMWIRPQNAIGGGIIGPIVEDLNTFGLAILAAPIACLISLFSGTNCIDDAIDLAHQVEPVGLIDSAIPGIGDIDGDDWWSMTGLWHFINVEAANDGGSGDFNAIPGMHYMHGGWRGGPNVLGVGRIDALDYGIIVGSDAIGLSLNPGKANGVSRYQQDPDGKMTRRRADWLYTIGHIEFEPLDNLALYGWRNYRDVPHSAKGLGWVLHAIGDSVAPHHTIAATGWGHRPYEEYVGKKWDSLVNEATPDLYADYADFLEQGYRWWKFIDDWQKANGNTNDVPVRDLITKSAFETRTADWAFRNGVSTFYGDGSGDEGRAKAIELYHDHQSDASALVHRGIGITLAFLTKASRAVTVSNTPGPCACAPGFGRGPLPDGTTIDSCVACGPRGWLEVNGRCVATCPADQPFSTVDSGHCQATCPDGSCNGIVCPAETPIVVELGSGDESPRNLGCSDTCDGVIIGGRECVDSCPPRQRLVSDTNYCVTIKECTLPNGQDGLCDKKCAPPAPFVTSEDECVEECPEDSRFFVPDEAGDLQCLATCPQNSRFFVQGEGGGGECLATCPENSQFFVADEAGNGQCVAACPGSSRFFWADGAGNRQCLAACPAYSSYYVANQAETQKCLAECPAYSAFFVTDEAGNHQCVAQCPEFTTPDPLTNECKDQKPPR